MQCYAYPLKQDVGLTASGRVPEQRGCTLKLVEPRPMLLETHGFERCLTCAVGEAKEMLKVPPVELSQRDLLIKKTARLRRGSHLLEYATDLLLFENQNSAFAVSKHQRTRLERKFGLFFLGS